MFISSRAEPQRAELGQVEPGRPGVRGLPAEDPVELDRVADRLVDLQRHLLAAEDQVGLAGRARRRGQQRLRLLGDPRRRAPGRSSSSTNSQPRVPYCPRTRRVGAALGLAVADRGRHDAAPHSRMRWSMRCPRWRRTTSRCPRPGRRLGQVRAGRRIVAVDAGEQVALLGERDRERVLLARAGPADPADLDRDQRRRPARHQRAAPGRPRPPAAGPARRGVVGSGTATKPHDDPTRARTPTPTDSRCDQSSTSPLRADIDSLRWCMARASAYRAPAASAALDGCLRHLEHG